MANAGNKEFASMSIQRMNPYSSIMDYNIQKSISDSVAAVNAAKTSQEADSLSQALMALIAMLGGDKSLAKGLQNPLLNNTAAKQQAAGNGNKEVGGVVTDSKERKAIFKDINAELGVGDERSDWGKASKTDSRIKVFDEKGNPRTDGKIEKGDIVEVTTKKYGTVRIQAGGDGQLNGNDDAILSIGTKTAANNVGVGLNRINTTNGVNAPQVVAKNNAFQLPGNSPLTAINGVNQQQGVNQELFNQNEMNNLLAAIMNMIMTSMDNNKQRQYNPNIEYQYS
jgi:hypothetical protein